MPEVTELRIGLELELRSLDCICSPIPSRVSATTGTVLRTEKPGCNCFPPTRCPRPAMLRYLVSLICERNWAKQILLGIKEQKMKVAHQPCPGPMAGTLGHILRDGEKTLVGNPGTEPD